MRGGSSSKATWEPVRRCWVGRIQTGRRGYQHKDASVVGGLLKEDLTMSSRSNHLGRVARKPVNPGLKVNRRSNFSSIKMLSAASVLCSLNISKLKTEGQEI